MAFLGVLATAGAVTAIVLTGGLALIPLVPLVAVAAGTGALGLFATGDAAYSTYKSFKKSDFNTEHNRLISDFKTLQRHDEINSHTVNQVDQFSKQFKTAMTAGDFNKAAEHLEDLDNLIGPRMSLLQLNDDIQIDNFGDLLNKVEPDPVTEIEANPKRESFDPSLELKSGHNESDPPNEPNPKYESFDRSRKSTSVHFNESDPPNDVNSACELLKQIGVPPKLVEKWEKLGLINSNSAELLTQNRNNRKNLKEVVLSMHEQAQFLLLQQKTERANRTLDECLKNARIPDGNGGYTSGSRIPIGGDGNCFYEAISLQVGERMVVVRRRAQLAGQRALKHVPEQQLDDSGITYFELNGVQIVGDELKWQVKNGKIAASAGDGGEWADETFAALIVEAYKRPVIVFRYNDNEKLQSGFVQQFKYENSDVKGKRPIVLTYDGTRHFEAVGLN